MGCNIHAYIEVLTGENWRFFAAIGRWNQSSFANILIKKRARGLPLDVTLEVKEAFSFRVVKGETGGDKHLISEADAMKMLKKGAIDMGGGFISNPDWISPSWLDLYEMERVESTYRYEFWEISFQQHVVNAMTGIAKHGASVRLVYWFDECHF